MYKKKVASYQAFVDVQIFSKTHDFLISHWMLKRCLCFLNLEFIIGDACPFPLLVTRPWKYVQMLVKSNQKLKKNIKCFSLLFNFQRFTVI